MIIEREGVKFYAPDTATTLINGSWTIDDSQLVLWSDHINTINNWSLITERDNLIIDLSNIHYADMNIQNNQLAYAVEQFNEPLIAESIRTQERIDEINGLII